MRHACPHRGEQDYLGVDFTPIFALKAEKCDQNHGIYNQIDCHIEIIFEAQLGCGSAPRPTSKP
jgi:hypothetical protein